MKILSVFLALAVPAMALAEFELADSLYKQRGIEAKARKALEIYRIIYKGFPDDPQAAWRFAAAAQFVGLRLTPEGEARETLYREGRDAAMGAVETNPECAPCQFWAGINQALYGESVGVFKMLFTLGSIRKKLEEAARLDPTYAYAGSYRVLGLIEQKLPGLFGGSDRRARKYFEKAIETVPTNPLNYLFMARLLTSGYDDAPAAAAIAEKGLALPCPPVEEVESHEAWEELKAFRMPASVPASASATPPAD